MHYLKTSSIIFVLFLAVTLSLSIIHFIRLHVIIESKSPSLDHQIGVCCYGYYFNS